MLTKLKQPSDGKVWFFKVHLLNGVEESYPLPTEEKERLWEIIPHVLERRGLNFLEFESKAHHILIQISQIACCQFLFEPAAPVRNSQGNEEEESNNKIRVYFTNNDVPTEFYVETDETAFNDPNDSADEGQINNFVYHLSHASKGQEVVHFMDEDGEFVFFRTSALALVEVPLCVL